VSETGDLTVGDVVDQSIPGVLKSPQAITGAGGFQKFKRGLRNPYRFATELPKSKTICDQI